jgi:hypothetical protein
MQIRFESTPKNMLDTNFTNEHEKIYFKDQGVIYKISSN